jgi:Heparinase II/III-like protein
MRPALISRVVWIFALLFVANCASAPDRDRPGAPPPSRIEQFGYPPTIDLDRVREFVDQAPTEHPRLLVTGADLAALRSSLDADPLRRSVAGAIVRQAELLRDVPPITRTLKGARLLGQSRLCLMRVLTLAMAYHLTGNVRFVERCEQEMLAASRFTDWNPSHFLDVAEMTFALAIGYDWLYSRLSEPGRSEIRAAIVDKGVSLPVKTAHRGWVKARNNWGQVCHGGLVAGALAIMEDEPDLAARTVHRAVHNVTWSMAAYAPAGGYPEGPSYWAYGTSYNVLLIGMLESALGTDFGLLKAPGFELTGQYPSLVFGPSGLYFNYSDGGARRSVQPAQFWLARRFQRPDWLLGERDRLQKCVSSLLQGDAVSNSNRFLPLTLLWMGASKVVPESRMPLHWKSHGPTPITVHRSSWVDPDATFVGVKGGSPGANHGHMDIGSFVLDCGGLRWAEDLGAESYHRIESRGMNLWNHAQDSDRWTVFRLSNAGHNTLVIDGQLQCADGHGRIADFSDDPEFPHSVVDMSSVYAGQAKSVRRGVALLPTREVLIQDELTGLKPGRRVRWGMVTRGVPESVGGSTVELVQPGARLRLEILSPNECTWRQVETAEPVNEWDSPNPGTRMLVFEAIAPNSGKLTLTVLATPGHCAKTPGDKLELCPLAAWAR